MAKTPQEPTPEEQAARDLVDRMRPEDMGAFLTALQTGGLIQQPGPPDPEPVELPDPPAEPLLVRVRVDLDGTKPPIWRRLELRSDLTVDRLHEVLQVAMGWTDSHLHRFWLGPDKRIWDGPSLLTDFDVSEGEEGPHEQDAQVGQVLREVADRLFYTYDFGDDWTHTIKVEAVSPLPQDAPNARCTGGRMACPPEDVGGVWSHSELVAAWREAPDRSTMPEDYVDWLLPDWDPTAFDPDQVNLMLDLLDATPEQLLAARGPGGPQWCAALEELFGRAPRPVVLEIAAAAALATEGEPGQDAAGATPVHAEALTRAVRPWQLLLEIAGSDGIPLTAAGWMKPAVVEQVHRELGLDEPWVAKTYREDKTQSVREVRSSAQRSGLLRKHRGRLVRTPRGRELTGDDAGLWTQLASGAIPDTDEFARDASVLYLLQVAGGGVAGYNAFAEVAPTLSVMGWRTTEGGGVGTVAALNGARSVWEMLRRLSGSLVPSETEPDLETARAFARNVLFPGP